MHRKRGEKSNSSKVLDGDDRVTRKVVRNGEALDLSFCEYTKIDDEGEGGHVRQRWRTGWRWQRETGLLFFLVFGWKQSGCFRNVFVVSHLYRRHVNKDHARVTIVPFGLSCFTRGTVTNWWMVQWTWERWTCESLFWDGGR